MANQMYVTILAKGPGAHFYNKQSAYRLAQWGFEPETPYTGARPFATEPPSRQLVWLNLPPSNSEPKF